MRILRPLMDLIVYIIFSTCGDIYMSRRRTILKSKNMMEISDHMTGNSVVRKHGRRVRAKKEKVTPEAMRKNNLRIARRKLRLLIDNNFNAGDYYLTLTFKERLSIDEAKDCIRKFNRRLRGLYQKANIELKYLYVMEGKIKFHFHMLINQGIQISPILLKELWPHGYTKIELYRGEAEDAINLANYFLKEKEMAIDKASQAELMKQKWVSSKNLVKPEEEKKILTASEWRKEIQVPKGYYLDTDSVYEGVNNFGYPFRTYRLIKLQDWSEVREKRKSTKALSILRE